MLILPCLITSGAGWGGGGRLIGVGSLRLAGRKRIRDERLIRIDGRQHLFGVAADAEYFLEEVTVLPVGVIRRWRRCNGAVDEVGLVTVWTRIIGGKIGDLIPSEQAARRWAA